ncbi:hypothetical protein CQA38_04160 [Campylobacter sp. MIT 12-5580]|uniref:DUF1796 family putative cysteine peptidase n=1 Tax=Campylobacter sp. MIT 12-5580 TaxID=2040651 RepID=UPI0010F8DA87|nr:DUF1796 family putative cysteine peptidase [Campylobacter sp. MIT 12-5580]TKX29281.1 hypothetical protein CQA38_04160 [Campylobacter sp. MIT 12-5580]
MNALQKIFQLFCRTNNDFKADLVLSCGNACRVAHYLHKYKLRKFSSPIDWMMSYSLEAVNNMFEEDFAYFFKDYEQMYEHNNMRVVKDKRNNMVAMHDFVMQKSIEEQYPHFIEQKTKRFKRLKKELLKARSVIFLCNRSENLQNFKDFLIRM